MIGYKILDTKKRRDKEALVITVGFFEPDKRQPFRTLVYEFDIPSSDPVFSPNSRGWVDDGQGGLTRAWVEINGEWEHRTELAQPNQALTLRQRVTNLLDAKVKEFERKMEFGTQEIKVEVEETPSRLDIIEEEVKRIEKRSPPRRLR